MGKGSSRRPTQVERDEFDKNWDYVFKREKHNGEMKRKKKRVDDKDD